MRVYLAGPINDCSDAEAKDWRAEAKTRLLWTFDPMDRDYRGRELAFGQARRIVEGDKRDIDACDALLAFCPKPSVGTSMEVLYAHERHKTVIVVAPDPASPWLIYHAHAIYETLHEALDHLLALEARSA